MPDPGVLSEHDGSILRVRLDRPDKRNALSSEGFKVLGDVLRAQGQDPPVRCVVISSTTSGSFCSGFDLGAGSIDDVFSGEAADAAGAAFDALEALSVPVVALIDGPAHGGGCELALRCDLRLGTRRCSFAVPAARYGLPYSPASVGYVTRLLGESVATWLFVGGERIDAEQALTHGLLHAVVADDELHAEGGKLAQRIADGAPLVHAYLKEVIQLWAQPGEAEELNERGRRLVEQVMGSADFQESRAALSEGRPPEFQGD